MRGGDGIVGENNPLPADTLAIKSLRARAEWREGGDKKTGPPQRTLNLNCHFPRKRRIVGQREPRRMPGLGGSGQQPRLCWGSYLDQR